MQGQNPEKLEFSSFICPSLIIQLITVWSQLSDILLFKLLNTGMLKRQRYFCFILGHLLYV